MIQVSKNFKLGEPIKDLREIHRLAREGKAVVFKNPKWDSYNMKPAAFLQNWSIQICSKFEFYKVERI